MIDFAPAESFPEEPRPPPNDNVTPEVRDMIQFLLSTCILNHRIENQLVIYERSTSPVPAPLSPTENTPGNRKSISGGRGEGYASYANVIPVPSSRHFSNEKLPRDFILELRRKLSKSLHQGTQFSSYKPEPLITNPIAKRIYTQLLSGLTDSYNETINRSRRPEDLIVLFCSAAQKILSVAGSESETLEQHLVSFVQYLIYLLSRKGSYFTHKSLIRRLESYLNTLKSGNTLTPAVTHAVPSYSSQSQLRRQSLAPTSTQSQPDSRRSSLTAPIVKKVKKLIPNTDITFYVQDMPLAQYVARLFNVSPGYVQYLLNDLSYSATDKAAFDDLIKCKRALEQYGLHPIYSPGDFKDPNAYAKWKKEEIQNLNHDLDTLKASIPSFKDREEDSDDYYTQHDCVYVPRYPLKYYHTLISLCIKYENLNCEKDNFQFSLEALSLLEKIMIHWRLTAVSECMIILQEASYFSSRGMLSFKSLVDNIFPYAMEGLKTSNQSANQEDRSLNLQEWTSYEKSIAYLTMSTTLEHAVSEIVTQIDLTSSDLQPEIEKITDFINTYVVPFSMFDEFPRLRITENHLMAVREQVSFITEVRFQRESLRFPVLMKEGGISFTNMLNLINEVKSTTSRIHAWYQCIELFGFIDLAGLATQFYLISFIRYLKTNVLSDAKVKDTSLYDPESYTYEDFDQILDGLSDIVLIFERSMEQKATKDHDDAGISVFLKMRKLFAPLVLLKIQSSEEERLKWVERIIQEDSFEPLPEAMVSTSIVDLFTTFKAMAKVVTSLKWNSPKTNAEFCTAAMRVSISGYHEVLC